MTPEDIEQIAAIVSAAEQRIQEAAAANAAQTIARIERAEARIEQVETALLTEFHKWASPLEMRVRSHAAALRALDAEQEFQADRLSKLEGKAPDVPPVA